MRRVAEQLWCLGGVPRVWLRRYNHWAKELGQAWVALPAGDRQQWLDFAYDVERWPTWPREVGTLAVVSTARPFPQVYGAAGFWALGLGGSFPPGVPVVRQPPAGDSVVLMTSAGPPPPLAPLRVHVWATWQAPGGWGGSEVRLALFARSVVPLLQSNRYWWRSGFGGSAVVQPGVPVLLDSLLVAAGCSGVSPDSWLRAVLIEPGLVPFFVGAQERGSWFT